MNIKAVLTEVCKAFIDGDKIHVGTIDEHTFGVTTNGAVAYFMPKFYCPFDIKVITGGRDLVDFNRMIPKGQPTDAVLTNDMRITEFKKTAQRLTDGERNVWVDVKFLKNFIDKSTKYKITGEKTPVLVYEKETLIGMICPLNIKN